MEVTLKHPHPVISHMIIFPLYLIWSFWFRIFHTHSVLHVEFWINVSYVIDSKQLCVKSIRSLLKLHHSIESYYEGTEHFSYSLFSRLLQESLRRSSGKTESGFSLRFALLVALIGVMVGFLLNLSLSSSSAPTYANSVPTSLHKE